MVRRELLADPQSIMNYLRKLYYCENKVYHSGKLRNNWVQGRGQLGNDQKNSVFIMVKWIGVRNVTI